MTPLTKQELVRYEIYSSWWAQLLWLGWAQDLAAKYFVWKTFRKHRRYMEHIPK